VGLLLYFGGSKYVGANLRRGPSRESMIRAHLVVLLLFSAVLLSLAPSDARAQQFEETVVDVGSLGMTITNAGFFGRANARNNPGGPPSMRYPLGSGVEHLFEAGLWIGAFRSDGLVSVRSGAVTSSGGYRAGAPGYEFVPLSPLLRRSTLPDSEVFSTNALSHLDLITSFQDTSRVLPGSFIPHPDPAGRLGIRVDQQTHAWNFPFTDYFIVLNFDITNISNARWDSVYVGLYHNLSVRNIITTTDTGTEYFNKDGYGFVDSLHISYAFNAGGQEETINTYGGLAFLGAYWDDPATGERRFFHPNVANEYVASGYAAPQVIPRWWQFGGSVDPDLARPNSDADRYDRMARPYPDPRSFANDAAYQTAKTNWFNTLRTSGTRSEGNWIGMMSVGPFSGVEPGEKVTATFAFVGARKPPEYQGQAGKPVDTDESRRILVDNVNWARRIYAGEDRSYTGRLDPGEDLNNNNRLDRYLFPEPPASPRMRVELEQGAATLYWDRGAEETIDPVSGEKDFEGYRIYRTNPGDERTGDISSRLVMIAQYDRADTETGYNTGFDAIRLAEPVTFPGDTTRYYYRFRVENLLSGWQYMFAVTAFDQGDAESGLPSLESSRTATARRVFPGTPPVSSVDEGRVGVYPNPFRINAAWDGNTSRSRKLYFYNLPERAEIRIYTLAGEIVASMDHDAATYAGDTGWYTTFGGTNRVKPGGERAWDLLSESGLNLSTGLYLFSVRNGDTGETQTGRFVIIQ
jgi:hypothetical protein